MGKTSNTLIVLEILKDNRIHSRTEISKRLEVSERMISIYIEELEKSGVAIDHIRGRYGGYKLYRNNNTRCF